MCSHDSANCLVFGFLCFIRIKEVSNSLAFVIYSLHYYVVVQSVCV